MLDHVNDLDAIRALIQLYIDGSNGDGEKMRQAFHPNAWMFGHIGAMDTYEPITEFTAMVEAQPGFAGAQPARVLHGHLLAAHSYSSRAHLQVDVLEAIRVRHHRQART